MEMQIKESKKRYRTLFNEAPLGILIIDENGRIVEFNKEAHRHIGYTREEFAKFTIADYEASESPEEIKAHMKRIMRTGFDKFETKYRSKTGEVRDVINNVHVIELGGKKYFQVITQDITELKRTENELRMKQNMLEAVTENIGAGLAIISKDYRILWANKVMKEVSGDCEGKICYSTFNRLTHVCPDCGVKKIFEEGLPIDVHVYTNCDDKGNRFWVELIVTPIRNAAGEVIAALELAVNATERKMLEDKLKEYSEKLEQLVEERTAQLREAQAKLLKAERLAAIGELAAMVGHDLRNPMTAIKNAVYYLKKKGAACPDVTRVEMLSMIEGAIERTNKIVNDLLEYSRDIRLELQRCTPRVLLAEALKCVRVPKAIEVLDETADAPEMLVDKDKMLRVFVNLIRNAVNAMPSGGMLKVVSRWKADAVELVFSDTGVGIPDEVKARLFNPLVTTKAQGMGFGLAICKRIVEAHRGTIAVESALGKGATVTITLPLKPKMEVGEEKEWINLPESSLLTTTPTYENR
jgi:PAS domain S-box-containing protein